MNKILVTGSAGFIGFHLSKRLLQEGYEVYGIDNMNSYYDARLKEERLKILKKNKNFNFKIIDISDYSNLKSIFLKNNFSFVFHLAAQPGVRYSFENPQRYIDSNIKGFINVLDSCNEHSVNKLFYASSSSVYGNTPKVPFVEDDTSIQPISLYGVTKKMNEDLARTYHESFNLNTIGLRFFTVYGPWGRPDMALFKFTDRIMNNKPIELYNQGKHNRSFTYIDDIIESMILLYNKYSSSDNFNDIINIGGAKTTNLMDFVNNIEYAIGKKANLKFLPIQKGDLVDTVSSSEKLNSIINFSPLINIKEGIDRFVGWYKEYKGIL